MTSKTGRGGCRYRPYAFTEQGVAMLSSVLGSERAIAVNIEIMRAFVRMREPTYAFFFAIACQLAIPSARPQWKNAHAVTARRIFVEANGHGA